MPVISLGGKGGHSGRRRQAPPALQGDGDKASDVPVYVHLGHMPAELLRPLQVRSRSRNVVSDALGFTHGCWCSGNILPTVVCPFGLPTTLAVLLNTQARSAVVSSP